MEQIVYALQHSETHLYRLHQSLWQRIGFISFCEQPDDTDTPIGYLSLLINDAEPKENITHRESLDVPLSLLLLQYYLESC